MRLTDHNLVGLQYGVTAAVFLAIGFLLMLLMRWQLAWPTQPLPPAIAGLVTETNAQTTRSGPYRRHSSTPRIPSASIAPRPPAATTSVCSICSPFRGAGRSSCSSRAVM
ncbi:MAG: hypothetical protein ABR606_17770 [Vicinamibacterales bacterium]